MIDDIIHVNDIEAAEKLKKEYRTLGSYQVVADKRNVSKPMVWRVINQGYVPKKKDIRNRLGFDELAEVPVCPCGEVHTSKHCPNEPRRYRKQHRPRIHPTDSEWEYIKGLSADEKLRRLLKGD